MIEIFTSPISGAQKSGISGFIKGAFTGLTGLFLHPITGIVDGASKTAEGLKNSVIFKAGEGRARKIRVFYEFEQYFTTFNEEDSSMMEYLRIYKKGKFENLFFKKGVLLEKESCLLIFTMQKTLLMRIKNGKKVWSFNNEDFDRVENYSDGVRIGLKKKMKETEVIFLNFSSCSVFINIKNNFLKGEKILRMPSRLLSFFTFFLNFFFLGLSFIYINFF